VEVTFVRTSGIQEHNEVQEQVKRKRVKPAGLILAVIVKT
jgi:hypothetical protein